jgi:hypothetical protein
MARPTMQDVASRSLPMAKLGFKKRQSLPSSDFALPGRGEGSSGKGSGSYPIPDESHARNALARAAQHASPEEQAQIKRKVHAKFPGIEIGGEKKGRMPYTHSRKAR